MHHLNIYIYIYTSFISTCVQYMHYHALIYTTLFWYLFIVLRFAGHCAVRKSMWKLVSSSFSKSWAWLNRCGMRQSDHRDSMKPIEWMILML